MSGTGSLPRRFASCIRIGNYAIPWDRIPASDPPNVELNRKDAIVDSFDLDPRDPQSFAPSWKETPNEIQITVHRKAPSGDDQELLGYIRFDKKAGSLELANFKNRFEMSYLGLGGTTKRGHNKFAGVHGEGLKLAALVMHPNNHAVRISASSFYWNFGFHGKDRDSFHCRLSEPKPETMRHQKRLFAEKARPRTELISYIWKDVMVKISKGKGAGGLRVTEEDFRSWVTTSLDLSGPAPDDIIRTVHGDLILDDEFSGRIYLKGLLVNNDSGRLGNHTPLATTLPGAVSTVIGSG